jgi:hypothetical protein
VNPSSHTIDGRIVARHRNLGGIYVDGDYNAGGVVKRLLDCVAASTNERIDEDAAARRPICLHDLCCDRRSCLRGRGVPSFRVQRTSAIVLAEEIPPLVKILFQRWIVWRPRYAAPREHAWPAMELWHESARVCELEIYNYSRTRQKVS